MIKNPESGLWEVQVGDHKYEFSKWGAEESLDVLLDIGGIIGGPFGQLLGVFLESKGEGKSLSDLDISPDMLGMACDALMKNCSKTVIKPILKKLTSENVYCDGKKITSFNLHYQDRLDHMFMVAKAALEVQYGNFSNALRGLVKQAKPSVALSQVL